MPSRSVAALLAGAACAAFAALVWALVFHTGIGKVADTAAFGGFVYLQGTAAQPFASAVAALCNVAPYAVLSAALVGYAWRNRGLRHAVAASVVLVVPGIVTQLLKPALAAERLSEPLPFAHVAPASWPSGHSTAAMSLALAAVLVAPHAARRTTAIAGGLFAIAVGYSVVVLGWHMPSDALGGFAVAGAVAGVVTAALSATEARRGVPSAAPAAWHAAPILAAAAAVIAVAVARVAVSLPSPEHQAAFLAIAAAIVALPLALAAAAAMGVSRSR